MPLSGHLETLSGKHRVLEQKLEQAKSSPSTSDVEISELKREKLRIKDQIRRLSDTATQH